MQERIQMQQQIDQKHNLSYQRFELAQFLAEMISENNGST